MYLCLIRPYQPTPTGRFHARYLILLETDEVPPGRRAQAAAALVAGGKHPSPSWVKVAGVEYQPAVASANKKQAKADAAQLALQKLGILP
ncbi:hypothetical protein EVAR_29587_1 [Eumeta japonica]|uniref:DRBM domain-containing protein n=1 Tax=Eumeta variegata TaxID=151549 RepID=A0A4C1VUC3_EUMVA|nr:hypothetical protein EVAR_29587_1 [Eumeta japonica]